MAAGPSLHLDPADSLDGVPIAGLGIGGTQAPDIEADLEVPHTLGLPAASRLVGYDQILGSLLGPAADLGIEVFRGLIRRSVGSGCLRQYQRCCQVAHGAMPGNRQPVKPGQTLMARPLQVLQLVLGPLPCQGDPCLRRAFA